MFGRAPYAVIQYFVQTQRDTIRFIVVLEILYCSLKE